MDEILRLNPDNTEAHKFFGDTLAAQGKYAEAEAEYATALQLNRMTRSSAKPWRLPATGKADQVLACL